MWPDLIGRRLVAAGAVALLATAPAPALAQERVGECSPGLGLGLNEIPAGARDDPRAQTYVVDSVRPGAQFSRSIAVCNGTRAPVTVSLYAGAARIAGGAFTVVEGRAQSELTSWITVDPQQLTVPPGVRRTASVTFRVPASAEPGERYGVVLAELPPAPAAGGLSVASRVGIRVYLDVNDDEPASDFRIESLRAERRGDGTPVVTAGIVNTGGRALDLRGELELRNGPGGTRAGPFPAQLGTTLAPGDRAPVTVVLDRSTPSGPWLARLTARSGLLVRAAEATITFPSEAGGSAEPVAATQVPLGGDDPWVVVAGALIGLLALLLLLLLVREHRNRRRKHQEDDAPTPEPVGA